MPTPISSRRPASSALMRRRLPKPPRVVFTSSVASFGGGQQAVVPDDGRQVPSNSYGAQKAVGELLLQDASRKGFLDAVSIRLPTVIVRPGRPNKRGRYCSRPAGGRGGRGESERARDSIVYLRNSPVVPLSLSMSCLRTPSY